MQINMKCTTKHGGDNGGVAVVMVAAAAAAALLYAGSCHNYECWEMIHLYFRLQSE